MHKKRSIKLPLYKGATPLKFDRVTMPGTKYAWLLAVLFCCYGNGIAQPVKPLYVKDAKAENRTRLYKSLVAGISRNLSMPLNDSTEENWMDAFYSIELLRYRSPWVEGRIHEGFKSIHERSVYYQRSLIEMLYDSYPATFEKEVQALLDSTADAKVLAGCAAYLLKKGEGYKKAVEKNAARFRNTDTANPVITMMMGNLQYAPPVRASMSELLHHSFFKNATIVFSLQRKNRNFPGRVIVRDSSGNFVQDEGGNVFSVPQLARSISNMPGYISNGNTPQGIFRMYGMDVSKSSFIGPTPNIQLTMPFETSIRHFMNDSSIADSVWTEAWYRKLLPENWQACFPLYESFYAGKAGRTEIIAHGSAVDPAYYRGQPYYPITPTLGCLCTKELWNEQDGTRKESDQQKLVDAVNRAGGANGYYIVIELDDEQRAVEINDIRPLLK